MDLLLLIDTQAHYCEHVTVDMLLLHK